MAMALKLRLCLKEPRFWLLLLMAVAAVWVGASGQAQVVRPHDSQTYDSVSRMPLTEMLGSVLTLGYPLLLRAVRIVSPDYALLPWVHLGLHLLACWLLDGGLRKFGASAWQAAAASAAFLATIVSHPGAGYVLTDFPTRAVAVGAIALLLRIAAEPRRMAHWIGLTVVLALCYHLRPAYLFMIPLVPLAGIALMRIYHGREGQPYRLKTGAVALVGIAVLPFLAYCTLRMALVGHFGLVSFGGLNIVGVAAEMLDERVIETSVPSHLRGLAREIVARREARGVPSAITPSGIDIHQWDKNYNQSVWQIAYPAAVERTGADHIRINRELNDLSRAVLRARLALYLRFLAANYREGVGRLLGRDAVLEVCAALWLLLFAVRLLVAPGKAEGNENVGRASARDALLLLALAFALTKLLLVSLVEMTITRYVLAAGMLLPSAVAVLAFDQAAAIVARIRTARPASEAEQEPQADHPARPFTLRRYDPEPGRWTSACRQKTCPEA
jgi:hypothetical protein